MDVGIHYAQALLFSTVLEGNDEIHGNVVFLK